METLDFRKTSKRIVIAFHAHEIESTVGCKRFFSNKMSSISKKLRLTSMSYPRLRCIFKEKSKFTLKFSTKCGA